jgi:hypothetical protein
MDRTLRALRKSRHRFLSAPESSKENDRLFYAAPKINPLDAITGVFCKESQ